jgi:hypothetical protein
LIALVVGIYILVREKHRKAGLRIVACGILLLVIDFGDSLTDRISSSSEAEKTATTGRLDPTERGQGEREVTLIFGSNTVYMPWIGRNPFKALDVYFSSWNDFEMWFSESGELQISAVFRSPDQKVVAQMIANEWELNPNNYFKRNYNDTCLEVINEYNVPQLQIIIRSGDVVLLRGIVPATEGKFWMLDSVGALLDSVSDLATTSKSLKLKPLFKYPAESHLGELADW